MIRKWLTTGILSCLLLSAAVGSASAQPLRSYIDPSAAVNWQCPLNRGLVSWWIALPDQQRGVQWRDVAAHDHGTLTSMDPATDWVAATRPGGCASLDFDGTNDLVSLPTAVARTTWTVSAWIYQVTQTGYRPIYGANNNGLYSNAGVLTYYNGADRSASSTISANTWTHVVCSCHATNGLTFYFNGNTDGTNANVPTLTTTPQIGGWSTLFFSGRIDDAMLFNQTLSATEVGALYRDSLLGHPQMLAWQESIYRSPDPPGGGSPLLKILQQSALTRSKRSPANRAAETLYVLGP